MVAGGGLRLAGNGTRVGRGLRLAGSGHMQGHCGNGLRVAGSGLRVAGSGVYARSGDRGFEGNFPSEAETAFDSM